METVLIVLIVMSIVFLAVPSLASTFFASQHRLMEDWRTMSAMMRERHNTGMAVVAIWPQATTIDVVLRNMGNTRLADFERWDVIVQYYAAPNTYRIAWLPHADAAPSRPWWHVQGIYMDAATGRTEVYEPGILNPGEEMVVRITVPSPLEPASAGLVSVVAPNGVTATSVFMAP